MLPMQLKPSTKPQTVEMITAMGECMTRGSSGAGILKLQSAGSNREGDRIDWETRVFENGVVYSGAVLI